MVKMQDAHLEVQVLNTLLDYGISQKDYAKVLVFLTIRRMPPFMDEALIDSDEFGEDPIFLHPTGWPDVTEICYPAMVALLFPKVRKEFMHYYELRHPEKEDLYPIFLEAIDMCYQHRNLRRPRYPFNVKTFLSNLPAPPVDAQLAPWKAKAMLQLDAMNELLKHPRMTRDDYDIIVVFMAMHDIYLECQMAFDSTTDLSTTLPPDSATEIFFPAMSCFLLGDAHSHEEMLVYYNPETLPAERDRILTDSISNCYASIGIFAIPQGVDLYDLYMTRKTAPIDRLLARHTLKP